MVEPRFQTLPKKGQRTGRLDEFTVGKKKEIA